MEIEVVEIRSRGELAFVESEIDIPFSIRRVYYIHGQAAGAHRGFHAHKQLRQLLFCPYGAVRILLDDGREKTEVLLDTPTRGLLLQSVLWREMLWEQEGSVLCVLASEHYREDDYIRDYGAFLEYLKDGKHAD